MKNFNLFTENYIPFQHTELLYDGKKVGQFTSAGSGSLQNGTYGETSIALEKGPERETIKIKTTRKTDYLDLFRKEIIENF